MVEKNPSRRYTGTGGTIGVFLLAAMLWFANQQGWLRTSDEVATPATQPAASGDAPAVDDPIPELFRTKTSDEVVTVEATVVRLLADDNEGSRHQRFLVETPDGITVKVAHNIDLADRVPIAIGDTVRIRGEYEYTDLGGVLHWTHHDPKGWHEDGWIEHDGRRYGD